MAEINFQYVDYINSFITIFCSQNLTDITRIYSMNIKAASLQYSFYILSRFPGIVSPQKVSTEILQVNVLKSAHCNFFFNKFML